MIKPMWNAEAVKAYETRQGVELVNEPHPHYEPTQELKQMTGKQSPAPWNTTSPQRTWVGLTDEDIEQEFGFIDELLRDCVQRTEAKLKEKNT